MQRINLLYKAIQDGQQPNEIKLLIGKLGVTTASEMACSVNDDGLLPIDLCCDVLEKDRLIIQMLLPIMMDKTIKSLSSEIDTVEILKKYQDQKHTGLYSNIKIACEAINHARKIITQSSTHPELNLVTHQERKEIDDKINEMRKKRNDQLKKEVGGIAPDSLTSSTDLMKYLAIYQCFSNKYRIGNCRELSYLIFTWLHSTYPNLKHFVNNVEKADHFINLIGEGESQVLCDALSGIVCPVSEIVSLKWVYKCIETSGTYYNILTSFNPKHHTLIINLKSSNLISSKRDITNRKPLNSYNDLSSSSVSLFKRKKCIHNALLDKIVHKGIMTRRYTQS